MIGDAIRGALGGAVGTWLMDLVTTGLLRGQSEETTRREAAARPNGKTSVDNLVDRLSGALGVELGEQQHAAAAQVVHFGLGIVPGALYGVVRRKLPFIAAGHGLLYGIFLWAVNDEYLNTTLGFAGHPDAYPIETHVRGLVGHAVLGVTTETVLQLLE